MATRDKAKYYDNFYDERDFAHFKSDRIYIQYLCSFLPNPLNNSVLDVGCGRGYWSKLFRDCGIGRVVGIDISQVGLDIARRGVPSAEFILADSGHLKFEDNTFDMVFCQGLSEYNTNDLSEARDTGLELIRCLKNHGLFIFAYSTNLSGKKENGWVQHKRAYIIKYLTDLGLHVETIYLVERLVLLKLLKKHAFNNTLSKFALPVICRLTKLPICLVCIARKEGGNE